MDKNPTGLSSLLVFASPEDATNVGTKENQNDKETKCRHIDEDEAKANDVISAIRCILFWSALAF